MMFIPGIVFGFIFVAANAKVSPEVKCNHDTFEVRVNKKDAKGLELERWGVMPGCAAASDQKSFFIKLAFFQDLPCGITRIRNKVTNEEVYYHKVSITDRKGRKHLYKVSCQMSLEKGIKSSIVKRNVLPPEFVEPDYIEITSEVTGMAPVPELSVGVRQNGELIGDQITVSPGAPLQMEIYLDSASSSTYGILVSYMMVTDNSNKNETIIFNGCTQDNYVFENFKTKDGDFLTANFRAFKFPESNYLLFKGVVDVCLDKCQGIQCSNGEIGFGRRRRSLPPYAKDPNKLFEVSMVTFIKYDDGPLTDPSVIELGTKREPQRK